MKPRCFWILSLTLAMSLAANLAAQSKPEATSRLLSQNEAVRLAQAISASESEIFSRTHKYVSLEQLLDAPAFTERKALPASLDDSGQLKDHYLRLLASPDGRHYLMAITPTAAGCGFSVFSDDTAAIYPAGPLDCDEEH